MARFAIDTGPLIRHRNFRLLYLGQLVSLLGSIITYVAVPYHLYSVTKSTFAVGLLGAFQLVPLTLTGIWGGVLADSVNRRKLILLSEGGLVLCTLGLVFYAQVASPSAIPLYAIAILMSGLTGIHRPSLEALTPRLVEQRELPAVSALTSLRNNIGSIGGPALGGVVIAQYGIEYAYGLDCLTFAFSMGTLLAMRAVPSNSSKLKSSLSGVVEGFRYAWSRQELIGTYVVDILAMTFAMPTVLFPAIADQLGGAQHLGMLYSALSFGALLATLTSGWMARVSAHGMAVVFAASGWCAAIFVFGFCKSLIPALIWLGIAGFSDMISAIFRSTIWNQTIPDHYRGRLAGVEMISYSIGPLLGNAQLGIVAGVLGAGPAILASSLVGLGGVSLATALLPGFRAYRAQAPEPRIDFSATENVVTVKSAASH